MQDNIDSDYIETDFLVIGSGIAGLRAVIELSKKINESKFIDLNKNIDLNKKIVLVTKSTLEKSNSYFAQGGISAVNPAQVNSGEDSYDSHIENTIIAGDGLCLPSIVTNFAMNSYKDVIEFLIECNIEFSKENDQFELHQEGGHDNARIYCVGDYTGKAIIEKLIEIVKKDSNITIYENHTVVNLITNQSEDENDKENIECYGAYILNRNSGKVNTFSSKKTFLATGGAGRVFQFSTNSSTATGDGIAMAYRAGASLANMEFFQFHPTVFYEPNAVGDIIGRRFLLTEALRGKKFGGIITLSENSIEDFVLKYHKDGSHGTRDIVARAIDIEMKKGLKNVYLNVTEKVTGKNENYMKEHFPKIFEYCLDRGINISNKAIPVIPAAHYTCGGVVVDENGLTDINSLYAIGEVACTGLMGANRLASNSLPEAAMYGKLAVVHAFSSLSTSNNVKLSLWKTGNADKKIDKATTNQFWDTTKVTMSNLCGIDRNEQRLKAAIYILDGLLKATDEIYWDFYPAHEIIELRNLVFVSKLIAESALRRTESRGGHYRSDYPNKDDEQRKMSLIRKN